MITDLTAGIIGHKYVIEDIGLIATVINSVINDDEDDYYYYSKDVRVKMTVISLDKVFSITGFKVARAQVNF